MSKLVLLTTILLSFFITSIQAGRIQINTQNLTNNQEVIGRLNWEGKIDDEVDLIIRGSSVQVKTISGTEYNDGIFSFTSPLPDREVKVFVKKKEGRGSAKLIQSPTKENNYTAIVKVLDKNGGARNYDLEIYWTN